MTIYNQDYGGVHEDQTVTELVEGQTFQATFAQYRVTDWSNLPSPIDLWDKHDYDYEATRVFKVEYSQDPIEAVEAVGIPLFDDFYPTVALGASGLTEGEQENIRVYSREVENVENLDETHIVTIRYKSRKADGYERWEMRNTGETVETNFCIEQDKFGTEAKEYNNVVGLSVDGTIQGVSIPDKIQELVVTHWKTTDDFNAQYKLDSQEVENTLNNAEYYGQPAGSVLYKGYTVVEQNAVITKLEFRFLISPPTDQTTLTSYFKEASGSAVTFTRDKLGWEYMWIQTANKGDPDSTLTYTKGAYLAKIYDTLTGATVANFKKLGLSGKLE